MEQKGSVELLAPAGSKEAFFGAIHAGADAVYLGGSRFGARAYAENFTEEDLVDCIRYAHLWGRKVYLTVNTLVKEREFAGLSSYLKPYYEAGLDGVIVQDMGVLSLIREQFPLLSVHASTQMSIADESGVSLLQAMGVCRVVPARELSLSEIVSIKKKTGIAVECFIHGAMCYCYSGQCLFSSILGGRSGNRGRCAQPCRLPYRVKTQRGESGECYPLSLKDMCTIEHIPELIEAGIDSFKIEGRMKKPEYAAGVTAIYRKYIDAYYAFRKGLQKDWQIDKKDLETLASLYIRSERQDGYYHKHNGRDMVTLHSPAYSAGDETLLAGIRRQYIENRPRLPLRLQGSFQTGLPARLTLQLSGPDALTVEAVGNPVEAADRQPLTVEAVKKQLGKLGDTIFKAENMDIVLSGDAFYPIGALNALRREAAARLEEALLQNNTALQKGPTLQNNTALQKGLTLQNNTELQANTGLCLKPSALQGGTSSAARTGGYTVSLRTKEQLDALLLTAQTDSGLFEKKVRRVYIDGDLLQTKAQAEVLAACRLLSEHAELAAALPHVIREGDADYSDHFFELLKPPFSGVLVKSVDGMGLLQKRGYQGKIYADAGLYIWNRAAFAVWQPVISGFCLPFELTGGEKRELCRAIDAAPCGMHAPSVKSSVECEMPVYGRIPMMVTAGCVAKTTSGCQRKEDGPAYASLTDRYQKVFPVELNCTHCMNIIYNSVPLSLHGEMAKWRDRALLRLDFTVEDKGQTQEIIRFFLGEEDMPPYRDYTTGHEKRGVE